MSFKNRPAKSNPVQPTLTFVGDTKEHVLKVLLDGPKEDMPVLTSVGYARLPDSNKFVSFVIKSQGNEITAIQVDEPDSQMVAEEGAKINFANEFISRGFE